MKRVGIMGGSFDPIHIGHLILAETALEQFSLDKILFIPSGNPPHKLNREGRASVSDRMEITRLAIEGNPGFELSDIEARSDGVFTYTHLTLEALRGMNPDTEYYFIIGGDSLRDFPTWRCPEKIAKLCILIAAVRDQVSGDVFEEDMDLLRTSYGARIEKLSTGSIDISSTQLRERIRAGRSVRYYIPDAAAQYIRDHGVYMMPPAAGLKTDR